MIRRILAALACCAVLGCTAAPNLPVAPSIAPPTAPISIPSDGVLLATLGYRHAPADLTVPAATTIGERVDQSNTVVAIMTAPSGLDVASYLRRTLPQAGWRITADANNSLLFERGELRGAFTVTGPQSALSIRSDKRS